jgi:hypothetical protein
MIEGLVVHCGLDLLDDLEDVGFSVFVSVSSDSQVHLVGITVFLEGDFGAEDGVDRSHFEVSDLCGQGGGALKVNSHIFESVHIFFRI